MQGDCICAPALSGLFAFLWDFHHS